MQIFNTSNTTYKRKVFHLNLFVVYWPLWLLCAFDKFEPPVKRSSPFEMLRIKIQGEIAIDKCPLIKIIYQNFFPTLIFSLRLHTGNFLLIGSIPEISWNLQLHLKDKRRASSHNSSLIKTKLFRTVRV